MKSEVVKNSKHASPAECDTYALLLHRTNVLRTVTALTACLQTHSIYTRTQTNRQPPHLHPTAPPWIHYTESKTYAHTQTQQHCHLSWQT